jgi:ornithine cyclodeaminase
MNRTSLEAILLARPGIDTLHVRGRGTASTEAFVDYAKAHFPQLTTVAAVSSVEAAVRDADIVAVATSSPAGVENYPYLDEAWIKPGALVSAAATINLDKDFVIHRARAVVDRTKMAEAYAEEMPAPAHHLVGTLTIFLNDLIAAGEFDRDRICDLGEIVSGIVPARRSDDEIILFGINGMPVEDVAWGRVVYDNARAKGIGTWLDLWDTPLLA